MCLANPGLASVQHAGGAVFLETAFSQTPTNTHRRKLAQLGPGFPYHLGAKFKLRTGRCPQTWGRERCGGKGGDGKVGEAKVGRENGEGKVGCEGGEGKDNS